MRFPFSCHAASHARAPRPRPSRSSASARSGAGTRGTPVSRSAGRAQRLEQQNDDDDSGDEQQERDGERPTAPGRPRLGGIGAVDRRLITRRDRSHRRCRRSRRSDHRPAPRPRRPPACRPALQVHRHGGAPLPWPRATRARIISMNRLLELVRHQRGAEVGGSPWVELPIPDRAVRHGRRARGDRRHRRRAQGIASASDRQSHGRAARDRYL